MSRGIKTWAAIAAVWFVTWTQREVEGTWLGCRIIDEDHQRSFRDADTAREWAKALNADDMSKNVKVFQAEEVPMIWESMSVPNYESGGR